MIKICPRCDAVYQNLRWTFDRALHERLKAQKGAEKKLCPGCERVQKRHVDGIVTLRGKFLLDHKKEVLNLIMRIAHARRKAAVEARILNLVDRSTEVEIQTTDRHLAERIGKGLEKAFHGDMSIKWLKKEEFARIVWKRD